MSYNAWNANAGRAHNHTNDWNTPSDLTTLDETQRSPPGMPNYNQQQQQPAWGGPPPAGQGGPWGAYREHPGGVQQRIMPALSAEDIVILRECSRESLFYRSLPLTAALCTGLVLAARARNFVPRYYHYMGAVGVGYITGKISYRTTCEDKLINSKSNSPFVNAIRKRRNLFFEDLGESNSELNTFESSDWTIGNNQRRGAGGPIQDFDGGKPGGGGPPGQPGLDNQYDYGLQEVETLAEKHNTGSNTSYDELRQRNRASFKNI